MAVLKSINEPGATCQSVTGALKSINEPNTTITTAGIEPAAHVEPVAHVEPADPDEVSPLAKPSHKHGKTRR